MSSQRASQAADILWSAWQEKRLLEALPDDCRPHSLEEGYAIQDAMAARHPVILENCPSSHHAICWRARWRYVL